MNKAEFIDFTKRRGPLFENMPYYTANDIASTFGYQFAKETTALVEIHYIDWNYYSGKMATTKLNGTIVWNTPRGEHAEMKALRWLEENLYKKDIQGESFVSIKLYISQSPCQYCAQSLIGFVQKNKNYFMYEGKWSDKPLPVGIFEIFFPHGYYQATLNFQEAIEVIVKSNGDDESDPMTEYVMIKCEVMDVSRLKLLTKDKLGESFEKLYQKKFYSASAALQCAGQSSKIKNQMEIEKYLLLDVCGSFGNLKLEDHSKNFSIALYRGNLTAEHVADFKEKLEACPIGDDVFALSVGLHGFLPHHDMMRQNKYVQAAGNCESFRCYLCDPEGKCHPVCIWNGYDKQTIEEIIAICDGELSRVEYWNNDKGDSTKHIDYGFHQPYLFKITGPSLANT